MDSDAVIFLLALVVSCTHLNMISDTDMMALL